MFFKVVVPFYIPTSNAWKLEVAWPHQHLGLSFKILAILLGRYLIVLIMVLMSNALRINDFKCLFMHFLTIHMSFLVKYLFKSLAHFLNLGCLTFYYWVVMVLYIFWISIYTSSSIYIADTHIHRDIHTNDVCVWFIIFCLSVVYLLIFYTDLFFL